MNASFRQSQSWLHTWCGLVCGWLLFAIFFTGTTAIFRAEGQQWLQPELRQPAPDVARSLAVAEIALRERAPSGADQWLITLPTRRDTALSIFWSHPTSGSARYFLNARTGEVLDPEPRRSEAMNFLYQFHYSLMLGNRGSWVVAAMAVAMLVLLTSGVIIHKRIFKDFFTFRPRKPPARSWLDAHNVLAVLVLPFSLVITYSGLVIWWFLWMPAGLQMFYGGNLVSFYQELRPPPHQPASGVAAPLLPLDQLVRTARESSHQFITQIRITSPGDAVATVQITQSSASLWGGSDFRVFDGVSGKLLQHTGDEGRAADATQQILRILHQAQFASPTVRWLYFFMSTGACVMIATGLVLWTVKRREKALKLAASTTTGRLPRGAMTGWRTVEALNVGTVAGLLIATAAMFWANRLMPAYLPKRELWEVLTFFGGWVLSLSYASIRVRRLSPVPQPGVVTPRTVWSEQLYVAAVLYALLPAVNAVMIPHSALLTTFSQGQWVLAGFDLTLLGIGLLLALIARKVSRPTRKSSQDFTSPQLESDVGRTA